MPTDVLQAFQRRRNRQLGEFWRDGALIVVLSCLGGAFTIVRALQTESFVAALSVFEMTE